MRRRSRATEWWTTVTRSTGSAGMVPPGSSALERARISPAAEAMKPGQCDLGGLRGYLFYVYYVLPVIFLLSTGADPTENIEQLARNAWRARVR